VAATCSPSEDWGTAYVEGVECVQAEGRSSNTTNDSPTIGKTCVTIHSSDQVKMTVLRRTFLEEK